MDAFQFPRCQAIPGVDRASLAIDGREVVGYEYAPGGSRPFFYPMLGPSGRMLTRMGHPNPVGHDHHKSAWFGHQFVDGINFWGEPQGKDVQVRHRRVLWYEDRADWAAFAAELEWYAEGKVRLSHLLIAAVEPIGEGYALDLQSQFTSPDGRPVELGKTKFGFLGVRVAKTISEQFGGGTLTSSEGATGEDAIFGTRNRWVDYSGPVAPEVVEGICYLDHPDNPRHPSHWHVRRDGWMEAAFCLPEPHGVAVHHPLDLRYRLLIHPGPADRSALDAQWERFALTSAYLFEERAAGGFPGIRRGYEPNSVPGSS
ncbi:DUF6807 domain-containing protein [Tautonia plasticadhaerens]|uniref:Methane oxygenase PmoA n=1 Tax=Tautonia plasticadhaerens TaxID=2527974 RepID=A0A518H6H4_9BACT|nr:PmoA family protein [Tautonia plasticadhaerens]QDV36452.1 hypothetical protein ElP_43780 [Tautonia plasticadhaerens]